MEVIDSTNMEILSEFPVEYDEAELESPSSTNMKNCFIKASDDWVVIAANSKGSDEAVGDVAFLADALPLPIRLLGLNQRLPCEEQAGGQSDRAE